ncbi:MAG: hypothetical protein UT24_C0054G0003 [Candidatus Woesebacteria bacterium GW2011_GWB1_39_12]|uniref:Uncharacterized protein n=1 Tax=Candidatus Woesebacteria bacterium GW2011_GWB1_39_12 TaxID=1618574 RepID=A0A0G0PFX7_9BACT|nr:MAG: hypothetical protein UT24_C0054G0003 [Candidatus Woesebacteria bacterium GW2011_GWB1_39_12]
MTRTTNAWYTPPGIWNTNSYLSSGIPYVTGAVLLSSSFSTLNAQVKIEFPYVSRSITVINRSSTDIRIHFNSLSDGNVEANHHYVTLSESKDSITLSTKTKELYISLATGSANGEFELFSELTNIDAKEMFPLTGSGLTL